MRHISFFFTAFFERASQDCIEWWLCTATKTKMTKKKVKKTIARTNFMTGKATPNGSARWRQWSEWYYSNSLGLALTRNSAKAIGHECFVWQHPCVFTLFRLAFVVCLFACLFHVVSILISRFLKLKTSFLSVSIVGGVIGLLSNKRNAIVGFIGVVSGVFFFVSERSTSSCSCLKSHCLWRIYIYSMHQLVQLHSRSLVFCWFFLAVCG